MLIQGTPCPKCDEYWFHVPLCEKCGWYDDAWFKEQRKRDDELWQLFLDRFKLVQSSVRRRKNEN